MSMTEPKATQRENLDWEEGSVGAFTDIKAQGGARPPVADDAESGFSRATHSFDLRIEELYRRHGFQSPEDISLSVFEPEVITGKLRIMRRGGPSYAEGPTHVELFPPKKPIRVIRSDGPTRYRKGEDEYIIWIGTALSLPERRITIARGIGHILLHKGNQMWMADRARLDQDEEAERFAFYALAPTYLLEPMLKGRTTFTKADLSELAQAFSMPEHAMWERLAIWGDDNGPYAAEWHANALRMIADRAEATAGMSRLLDETEDEYEVARAEQERQQEPTDQVAETWSEIEQLYESIRSDRRILWSLREFFQEVYMSEASRSSRNFVWKKIMELRKQIAQDLARLRQLQRA